MRQRLLILLRVFIAFVAVFVVMKPVFMLYNGAGHGLIWTDWLAVPAHGLTLDLTTAGYLTALPWLALTLSLWGRIPWARRLYTAYAAVVAILLALILIGDVCLYSFWHFKLDATVFNYLDQPADIAASVSTAYLTVGLTAVALLAALIFWLLRRAAGRSPLVPLSATSTTTEKTSTTTGIPIAATEIPIAATGNPPSAAGTPAATLRKRLAATLVFLVVGGLLFLAIRGGVGKSTANVGKVYYSANQFLNHAAVNPAFSLFASAGKMEDFAAQCNFYPEAERARLFAALQYDTTSVGIDTLLRTPRPNVLVIIMEGFGGMFVESLGGRPGTAPQFERLAREGVFFTNCYANSFRTDRGVVAVLSGYPALTTASVMKLPDKSRTLPAIASSLAKVGYSTDFLYGGDVNFTNMNSYLLATGYQHIYGDTDFPADVRRTHDWGVTDHITFDRLYDMVTARSEGRPWHTAFLTLASHEPWKVPYNRIPTDERANAMAYLDDCLGRFVERLRRTPQWQDLLIVCLPDHGIQYPDSLDESHPLRNHIPMLWLGGAVRQPRRVKQICNQTDLAATLLGQMGLPHGQFRFSRDVMSQTYRYPCAINVWASGLAFYDNSGFSAYDLNSGRPLAEHPISSTQRINFGKAFLQTCFDDLAAH